MSDFSPFKILDAAADLRRDTSRPVMLIGFQQQGNLGLGYLTSTLREHGYRVRVFDFEADPQLIVDAAQSERPLLIGFSLIFQYYVHRFGSLAKRLRAAGVTCHFTIGGHFPSLSYQHTLELIPDLDSVVRFEGESTLLELVDLLGAGREWRGIKGIAYRQRDEAVATPARSLAEDLDKLPYPAREYDPQVVLGRNMMPILASRGCARTCSFCSIHMFYRAAPGKVVRTRKPVEVVREMQSLYEERNVTIFLFQDDDFPLYGPVWRRWTQQFVDELHRSGLPGRAIWKMNCRADVVEPELFTAMREAGLYVVYMGLESGTEEGLKTLHKQITVEQNERAVAILKSLGLRFEFGFMLFDPSSTFESIRENIAFLRRIVGDGSAAASFCRMLPYDGTPIKDALAKAGRLRGDVCNPDYDFLDDRVNRFYEALIEVVDVTGWIHGYRALSPEINRAWHEAAVLEALFPPIADMRAYKDWLRALTQSSNHLLLQVVEDTSRAFSDGAKIRWSRDQLQAQCKCYYDELLRERDAFIGRHQDELMNALGIQAAYA